MSITIKETKKYTKLIYEPEDGDEVYLMYSLSGTNQFFKKSGEDTLSFDIEKRDWFPVIIDETKIKKKKLLKKKTTIRTEKGGEVYYAKFFKNDKIFGRNYVMFHSLKEKAELFKDNKQILLVPYENGDLGIYAASPELLRGFQTATFYFNGVV